MVFYSTAACSGNYMTEQFQLELPLKNVAQTPPQMMPLAPSSSFPKQLTLLFQRALVQANCFVRVQIVQNAGSFDPVLSSDRDTIPIECGLPV